MNQSYEFPRITTRGYYDLHTGESLGKSGYYLYPKKKFDKIAKDAKELVIFVHGMRNSKFGAKRGALTLRQTLRKIGYKKHPVVAFSYDADIRGAHLEKNHKQVLKTAYKIAEMNGVHLSKFIDDLHRNNPKIKIHLVGHSLGCDVVSSALHILNITSMLEKPVTSAHLFGSPLECDEVERISKFTKVTNYWNPTDLDIKAEITMGDLKKPSCIVKPIGVKSIRCLAKDHRFRSYAEKLSEFP